MRAFSLIEVMVSLGIAALTGSMAVAAFQRGVAQAGAGDREWIAFTLAQQQLEMLAAAPRTSALLDDVVADAATPGSRADANCATGVDGRVAARVDALGVAAANGPYELCWKTTDDHPSGSLKNVRAIVTFPSERGERKSVQLQVLR